MASANSSESETETIQILLKLNENDLISLAKTVTQGLRKSQNSDDAIQNIIKYSPDLISILRRKIVTREILFDYLEEKSVKVRLPVTKNELIDRIVELWNIPRIGSLKEYVFPELENTNSVSSEPSVESSSGVPRQNTDIVRIIDSEGGINLLAEQFAKWFYTMLNSDTGVGSEHFYSDAKLNIRMYVNDDCDSTIVENDPEEIRNTFLRIKFQHNLFFNLNDSKEGVQGRMNPHGLVLVLACGTLHTSNMCAGVFEQVFALARDPFCENNWKVKTTELHLRSRSAIAGPPSLCDSELTSSLLMLPSN